MAGEGENQNPGQPGTGGNGGAAEGAGAGNENALENHIKALAENQSSLAEGLQALQQSLSTLAERMPSGQGGNQGSGSDEPDGTNDPLSNLDPDSLETLSRKEFMDVITNTITASIEKQILKPLKQELQQTKEETVRERFQREINELKTSGGVKDFDEWKDEMRDLIARHPTLSVKELYNLARFNNPEKAKQLDEKYTNGTGDNPSEGNNGGNGNGSGQRGFTGFRPGSGGPTKKVSNMSKADAATAAWDEVMQNVDLEALAQGG